MKNRVVRRGVGSRAARGRAVRPVLEALEGRLLLYANTGDHFAFGSRITLSLMPDGTNYGGATSNLISTLNNDFGAGNWQPAFLAAAAWWENQANINLVWAGDDGSDFGSGNYQQGDPNKGDIRIGGFAQPTGTLAFTILPPPANGDSTSGDIIFNTNEPWSMTNTGVDLETTAIHEIGHALGLGHSSDTNASMYATYNGAKQGLNTDDIAGIQSIWGPRQEDYLARTYSNFWFSNAANITPFMNAYGQIALPYQNVAKASESYYFKFTTPANASSNLSVVVQSSNLSQLSPKVQLYDANTVGLLQVAAPVDSYGTAIGLTYTNAKPNTVYYIRLFGTSWGPTGTGAYALEVNTSNIGMPLVPSPYNTQVAVQPNQGGGGSSQVLGGAGGSPMTPGVGTPVVLGGANTPADNPVTVIFPTFRAQGDFLMKAGVAEPKVYRVGSVPEAHVVVPHSTTASTTAEHRKIATHQGVTHVKVQHPAGPASAHRRPAQVRQGPSMHGA